MAKDNRPLSWKEKRDRATKNNFIGRADELSAFRASLTNPETDVMIFSISGQGGVGKTTLLQQFCQITQDQDQVVAYMNEGSEVNPITNVPESMDRLAKSLEEQGGKFEKFYERYKTYRQKKQELEADPEAPGGIAAGIGKFGAKAMLGGMKAIPGVGEAMNDLIDIDSTASKIGDLASFAWNKFRKEDEVQLVMEPEEVLTPLWIEEVNRIAKERTVILLLDTYEQTGKFLDDWLRALLEERYGELTGNFRLCIAGRDPLNRNLWTSFEQLIARSPLEPFTNEEARQYLTRKGITSEDVISEILRLAGDGSSGVLPLLLSMMAQSAPTSLDAVVDCCESAVERFLKWETDEKKRQIARLAALPRILNADIVGILAEDQFDWLKTCPFVVENTDGWQYHSVVREQMLRHLRRESPGKWKELHMRFAKYYDELRKGLKLTDIQQQTNKIWQKYTLEWLYHGLCASPSKHIGMALNGWLMTFESEGNFSEQWAKTIRIAEIDTDFEDVKSWGQRIQNAIQNLENNICDEMVEVLSMLSKEPFLDNKCRAIAIAFQVLIPFSLSKEKLFEEMNFAAICGKEEVPSLNKTIELLTQAINLIPEHGVYLVLRSLINKDAGYLDSARSDLLQIINTDQSDKLLDGYDNELKENIQLVAEKVLQNIDQKEEYLRLQEECLRFSRLQNEKKEEYLRLQEEVLRLQNEIQRRSAKADFGAPILEAMKGFKEDALSFLELASTFEVTMTKAMQDFKKDALSFQELVANDFRGVAKNFTEEVQNLSAEAASAFVDAATELFQVRAEVLQFYKEKTQKFTEESGVVA